VSIISEVLQGSAVSFVSDELCTKKPARVQNVRAAWDPCRGLRREQAARYIGISATKFDQLVADGRMPKPIRIDGCVIWDLSRLDVAFDSLSRQDEGANPWD